MSIPFEQEYEDVLQNIEFAIISAYREQPEEISDWSVEAALDALIRAYAAEHTGRTLAPARLSDAERAIYDRVHAMCEWRMGRTQLTTEDGQPIEAQLVPTETEDGQTLDAVLEPIGSEDGQTLDALLGSKTPDEIVACLKRIRTSVKRWHKSGGRRGYLDFVGRYVR